MTAVLAGGEPTPRVGHGGLSFCFMDVNPVTGRAFYKSWFDDLPLLIQTVVEQRLGLNSWTWNKLVRAGEVAEIVDVVVSRVIPWTSAHARRLPRGWEPPADACADCGGTGGCKDTNGSITGVRGGWYVCLCFRLSARQAPRTFDDVARGYGFRSNGRGGWR